MKSVVALVRCDNYNQESVDQAVQRGIDLLGGIEKFAKPSENILLKPNLLAADPPEQATCTHPAVLQAAAKAFGVVTQNLTFGDSAGYGKPLPQARKAGYMDVAEKTGMTLAEFSKGTDVEFSNSPYTKKFKFADGVLAADGIVSLSKFKSHGMQKFTGAVKNQLGCVPGLLKAEWHVKLPGAHEFGKMLTCINLYLKPRLYIMDGILAMEGNGPRGGTPTSMNVLLFSSDPIALDATACRMIDVQPNLLPTNLYGQEYGLGFFDEDKIELIGDSLQGFLNPNFDIVRKPLPKTRFENGASFLKNMISHRPEIDADKCITCGICVQACPVKPVKALDWKDGDKTVPPVYDYKKCIRCFCCQEMCPEHAIHVATPWFAKVVLGR